MRRTPPAPPSVGTAVPSAPGGGGGGVGTQPGRPRWPISPPRRARQANYRAALSAIAAPLSLSSTGSQCPAPRSPNPTPGWELRLARGPVCGGKPSGQAGKEVPTHHSFVRFFTRDSLEAWCCAKGRGWIRAAQSASAPHPGNGGSSLHSASPHHCCCSMALAFIDCTHAPRAFQSYELGARVRVTNGPSLSRTAGFPGGRT